MKKIYNTNAIYTKNEKNIQCTGKRIHCKWKLQKTHKNNTVQMKTYTSESLENLFKKYNTKESQQDTNGKLQNTKKSYRMQMEPYTIQMKVIEHKSKIMLYR